MESILNLFSNESSIYFPCKTLSKSLQMNSENKINNTHNSNRYLYYKRLFIIIDILSNMYIMFVVGIFLYFKILELANFLPIQYPIATDLLIISDKLPICRIIISLCHLKHPQKRIKDKILFGYT